jgi:hypothetical protein
MDYTDEVLEATPVRVTKFLLGLGAVPAIRTLLEQGGMTDKDIGEGRRLLLDVLAAPRASGSPGEPVAVQAPRAAAAVQAPRAAAAELDRWEKPNCARFRAALRRRFPDVEAYVFDGPAPAKGAIAVNAVAKLLARIETLEEGSDPRRAGTRQADRRAVALLSRRGLDKTERRRLQTLVDVALGASFTPPPAPRPQAEGARRRAALRELRAWFDEWSSTAKAVLKQRNHRIRLGLASRKPPTRRKAAAPR